MERGDNVVLGNMCENLPHEMVPMTKFSAFGSWTNMYEMSIYVFCIHMFIIHNYDVITISYNMSQLKYH